MYVTVGQIIRVKPSPIFNSGFHVCIQIDPDHNDSNHIIDMIVCKNVFEDQDDIRENLKDKLVYVNEATGKILTYYNEDKECNDIITANNNDSIGDRFKLLIFD